MNVHEAQHILTFCHVLSIIILNTLNSITYNMLTIALYNIDISTQRHTTPFFAFIPMGATQCVNVYVVC